MKDKFVKTSNVQKFGDGISALEKRGANEASIMVVDGLPGLGKTRTIRNFVNSTESSYLRPKTDMSLNWLLGEILRSLGESVPHSRQQKFDKLIEVLAQRYYHARRDGAVFALVIDEGDKVSRSEKLLECIRDISDDVELPTILVGAKSINDNLKRFQAFSSRVSQRVTFEPCSIADVRLLMDELCEFTIADDVCKYVLNYSRGFNREIIDTIAKVERIGKRLPLDDNTISLSDLVGHSIMQDRQTSKEIIVQEVM